MDLNEGFPKDFPIIWAKDEDFESSRLARVFNDRHPTRHPIAVVHAASENDVLVAVDLAKKLDCKISIRSGGHSFPVWSVRENAILIDFGRMNSIEYDSNDIVKVGPATTGQDLNKFLATKGRMFNCAHHPTVGLGGFLLQGGMGWNCRGWGWAAEQIVGIDVVTADGLSVFCNEDVNSDLFWSARGSGPGFFAIVTRFHLRSRPIPSGMLSSTYIWNISKYDEVMTWVIERSQNEDPNIEILALSLYPDNKQSDHLGQQINIVVHVVTFSDQIDTARASLNSFSATAPAKADLLMFDEHRITSIDNEFGVPANINPRGFKYRADNAWIHNLPTTQVVDAVRKAFVLLPTAQSFSLYYNMGSERPRPDMALSLQTQHYLVAHGIWKEESDGTRCHDWLRSLFRNIDDVSPGVYIGDADFELRKAPFLGPGRKDKLERIRDKWDPRRRLCGYLGLEEN